MQPIFIISVLLAFLLVSTAANVFRTVPEEDWKSPYDTVPGELTRRPTSSIGNEKTPNWGDLLHSQRTKDDVLLNWQTWFNPKVPSTDTSYHVSANFSRSVEITHVRALNFGDKKAEAESIFVGSDPGNGRVLVDVGVIVKAKTQVRLMILVYGRSYQ